MSIPSQGYIEGQQSQSASNAVPIPQSSVSNGFTGFTLPFGGEEMMKAVQAANTPTAGGHSQNIPASLQPQPPAQPGQAPLNHQQVVGKGNARAQGIGNAITGGLNALSGVVTALANKKQTEVSTAAQTVFDAQHNIDQAKEAQKGQDPQSQGYKDAQAVIDQNTKRINGLDPKMQKAIMKGLQIDYTKPESYKSPEAQAVNAAKEGFTKEKTFEDKLSEGLPQQMAPNAQAQQKLAYMQEANKQSTEIQKAAIPAMIRADWEERNSIRTQFTAITNENNRIQNARFERLQSEQFQMSKLDKEYQQALSKIDAETNASAKREADRLALVNSDPNKITELSGASDREWNQQITSITNQIAGVETAMSQPGLKEDQKQQLTTTREMLKARLKDTQDMFKNYGDVWDAQRQSVGVKFKERPNGTGDGTNSNGNANSGGRTKIDQLNNPQDPTNAGSWLLGPHTGSTAN